MVKARVMKIEEKILRVERIKWRDLEMLQPNNFKDFPPENRERLRRSIINNGFIETFKVWENKNRMLCLDGFHRTLIFEDLIAEGYKVPEEFFGIFVDCKDRKDALKKVLIYSSIYANITDEGLYKMIQLENLNFKDIALEIDIPNFSMKFFEQGYLGDNEGLDALQKKADESSEFQSSQGEKSKEVSLDDDATKQFVIYLSYKDYKVFVQKLDAIRIRHNFEDFAQTIEFLIEHYDSKRERRIAKVPRKVSGRR